MPSEWPISCISQSGTMARARLHVGPSVRHVDGDPAAVCRVDPGREGAAVVEMPAVEIDVGFLAGVHHLETDVCHVRPGLCGLQRERLLLGD